MPRLSSPLSAMQASYDVVVIGSGYGGAIAACRLARAGRSVCILERGRELHPGDYPEGVLDGIRQVQTHLSTSDIGRADALFDLHVGPDITVLVGCGLGGTSLINANVALEAAPGIFDDDRWPKALSESGGAVLGDYYQRARTMLGSNPYPNSAPELGKLAALQASAEALGRPMTRPDINVTFETGVNVAGVHQVKCNGCGNCVTGCNVGAKNTVLMNYLPDAHAHGAQIFTGASVRTIERGPLGKWRVTYQVVEPGGPPSGVPTRFVTATAVVLSAGTLGSTEIMLRSALAGLPISDRVGHRFSGNGDVLAFAYDSSHAVHGVGRPDPDRDPPGPCITGLIDLRDPALPPVGHGLVIQDAVVPGSLAPLLPLVFAVASIGRVDRAHAAPTRIQRIRDVADAVVTMTQGSRSKKIENTLTLLAMSYDDGTGRLVLDNDRIRVEWVDIGKRPPFPGDNAVLRDAAAGIGATYLPNPMWTSAFDDSLITVQPLGGCAMGDDATTGVVDDRGRVFAGPTGSAVHPGLYIADGSIIPCPLGVNPSLTISALAERIAEMMIRAEPLQRHERPGESNSSDAADEQTEPSTPGLRFTERMHGWFSTKVLDDPRAGYVQGKGDGSPIEFVATIDAESLARLAERADLPVALTGTVSVPALAATRLVVTHGAFTLFWPDPARAETSYMRYEMDLSDEDGRRFRLSGQKTLRHGLMREAWRESTTLAVHMFDGHGVKCGSGMMRVGAGDFARLLRTMRVTRPAGNLDSTKRLTRFAGRFARELLTKYGGVLGEPWAFDAKVPASARRDLRLPPPEQTWCTTASTWSDSEPYRSWLRLSRYQGGSKGPVVLAPGFGMSTGAYVADTIETNITEFLFEAGYDVWLFDPRWSPDLPSARDSFSIDDVARVDWPTAISRVLECSGSESVQVVAHCLGSMSFLMAVLAGMTGVRSAVCSQVTLHPVATWFQHQKVAARIPELLQSMGLRTISPDLRRTVGDVALDTALRLSPIQPDERCSSAACRWIFAFYGPTHRHEQLNAATHADLGRLFGVADLDALKHIGNMIRVGRSVDRFGNDTYLPHHARLNFPLLFLAGADNRIFLPDTSLRTQLWLKESNPELASLYERILLPDYAHLDGFIGQRSLADVYPVITNYLERTAG